MPQMPLEELARIIIFQNEEGKYSICSFDEEYDDSRVYYDTYEEVFQIVKESYRE
jgi:hypothetical protein